MTAEIEMNQVEATIVAEVASALRALNSALEKAHAIGLEVKVDYTSVDEFGKKSQRRIYFADVSKLAFSQRVG